MHANIFKCVLAFNPISCTAKELNCKAMRLKTHMPEIKADMICANTVDAQSKSKCKAIDCPAEAPKPTSKVVRASKKIVPRQFLYQQKLWHRYTYQVGSVFHSIDTIGSLPWMQIRKLTNVHGIRHHEVFNFMLSQFHETLEEAATTDVLVLFGTQVLNHFLGCLTLAKGFFAPIPPGHLRCWLQESNA